MLTVACGGAEPAAPVAPAPTLPTVAVVPTNDDAVVDTSDEDDERYCEVACAEDGLCAIREGACVALENGHCRLSRGCERDGRCTAEQGVCVATASVGDHPCDRWVTLVRACMPHLPPEIHPSLEEAIRGITEGRRDLPEGEDTFVEACEKMIVSFSQLPMCAEVAP